MRIADTHFSKVNSIGGALYLFLWTYFETVCMDQIVVNLVKYQKQ